MKIITSSITFLVFCFHTSASEEEFMNYEEVKVITEEYQETGKVVFHAKTDKGTLKSLVLNAFNKEYKLSHEELKRIKKFNLATLEITHEAGYKTLGGHTVHFRLSKSYYKNKKLITEKILLSIFKDKGLEVNQPQVKKN